MRRILVDHARKQRAAKRGGDRTALSLDELPPTESQPLDEIALDDVLMKLARVNPEHSQIVELRFFAGLSIEETAQAMELSPAAVKRGWAVARVWLYRELARGTNP